jgi:hypothetical protein
MREHCGLAVDSLRIKRGQKNDLCALPTGPVMFSAYRILFVHKLNTVLAYFTQALSQPNQLNNSLIFYFCTLPTGLTNTTKVIKGY